MIKNAELLVAQALKMGKLHESFSPFEVGAKVGLSRSDAQVAARALSNAGVLVLGFDYDARFTSEYRKIRAKEKAKEKAESRPRTGAAQAAAGTAASATSASASRPGSSRPGSERPARTRVKPASRKRPAERRREKVGR